MRLDSMLGNVERGHIGERAFQAVADLNVHFAVLNEYKQDSAVPFVLLADAPRFRDALRVRRHVIITLHLWKNRDHDLVRSFPLELRELFVKPKGGVFRNNAGVIVEVTSRFWRDD